MTTPHTKKGPYPRAGEGAKASKLHIDSPQTRSPSYKLAYQDEEFLLREELRQNVPLIPFRLRLTRVLLIPFWATSWRRPGGP